MPRFGISNLPLSPDLLDKLETEKYLNYTFNILEGQIIEETHIKLDGSHFPHKEVTSLEKAPYPGKEP